MAGRKEKKECRISAVGAGEWVAGQAFLIKLKCCSARQEGGLAD